MICSRCKKRNAVVFITTVQDNVTKNEGLCLLCAKEMGVPQIEHYIKQFGISEEDLEQNYNAIMGEVDEFSDDDDSDDDDTVNPYAFQPGGVSSAIPPFIQAMLNGFTGGAKEAQTGDQRVENINRTLENRRGKDGEQRRADNRRNKKHKNIDLYSTNLTDRAKRGELDNIIGRDREITRMVQILSRRTKNNPCLIGEPGVGKTAIVEGLAQRFASGNVPFRLRGKEIFLLDLTGLVAGTQYRGQFESRIKSVIEEARQDENVILFIDEFHRLVGAGEGSDGGSMDAANILKPALSRGEIQVIGATTFNEYRKHIEKDAALERRFQPITVNEPTIAETAELLRGIKKYYEAHHKVVITDDIVYQCAVLSERYINNRFLPDKAIDLMDEAAACAGIKNDDIAEFEGLKKEILAMRDTEEQLLQRASAHNNRQEDWEEITKARTNIALLEQRLAEMAPTIQEAYITEEDLSRVIELWTGIPASKIMETEFQKIGALEVALKAKVVGQDEACRLVAAAIRRSRVQLNARRRPASFIFVGPTGVGKTELVKVLAGELFDSVEPLIRLDMSEYTDKWNVSRMIGSSPGYIDSDKGGQLTEKVRRKPYSVVLFDEIEKAHPDVMNILLQILDEGHITDAMGRTVNFEHTIICMTSNAGSTDKSTGLGFAKTAADVSKERAMKGLKDFLRPEFLGRIDEIVTFGDLSVESYAKIAKLMLSEMEDPLKEQHVELCVSDDVYAYIAGKSFGQKFGGRDIRRVIRTEIEDKVAEIIVEAGEKRIAKLNISAPQNQAGDRKLDITGE